MSVDGCMHVTCHCDMCTCYIFTEVLYFSISVTKIRKMQLLTKLFGIDNGEVCLNKVLHSKLVSVCQCVLYCPVLFVQAASPCEGHAEGGGVPVHHSGQLDGLEGHGHGGQTG